MSQNWITKGMVWPGSTWIIESGAGVPIQGTIGNAGTVILEAAAYLQISGDATDVAYSQAPISGYAPPATYLHGNSQMRIPLDKEILIDGGILATVYSDDVVSGNATITTGTLEVNHTDIYVNYGQGTHIHFGELVVWGNMVWNGGTFHPYVYSGGANDVWRTTGGGNFTINGGTIAPIYLDSDYGTSSFPTSGSKWKVLKTGGGGVFVNNVTPSVDNPTLWKLEPDNTAPPIFWELIALSSSQVNPVLCFPDAGEEH